VRVLTSTASGQRGWLPQPGTLDGLAGRWIEDFGVPTYYARVYLPPDLAPGMLRQLGPLYQWAQVVHVTGVFSAASALGMATTLLPIPILMPGETGPRPVVVSPRGALLPWALGQGRSRLRKQAFLLGLAPLLRRVAGWHVTSEQEADAVRALVGPARIQIAPPGVDPTNGSGDSDVASARPASRRLLVLGRIHPVKNLELALAALAVLRRQVGEAGGGGGGHPRQKPTLVIAGPDADPRYVAELQARAAALGVADAVEWPGLVTGDAKQRLLADSAALWLCSHMESFGNVVVEALAAGTPVVATTTTPWALLDPEGVGHHVAPTPDAIAAATRDLLQRQREPTERQALARRCQALAQARFGWAAAERQLRALYHAVLADARRGPRQGL
jgi:glycosyltransferase involved in cell wall biosynthesis